MSRHFFITGIPRSRTAWFANFLTTENAFCFHDAMKDGWSVEHVFNLFQKRASDGFEFVGDSDSGLLLYAEKLTQLFPATRWLFIRNTPERATESYRKWFTAGNEYPGVPASTDIAEMMRMAFQCYNEAFQLVPAHLRMEVALDDLNNAPTMRKCWDWLVPGLVWDEARYRMLDTFSVNILPKKITSKFL
jgi:hypothetical protein